MKRERFKATSENVRRFIWDGKYKLGLSRNSCNTAMYCLYLGDCWNTERKVIANNITLQEAADIINELI